jgi:hypothetical protein
MMLTAAHVVGSLSSAHLLGQREVLLLPDVAASSSSGDPRIGDVVLSDPAEPTEEIRLDACLVRVDDHVTLRQVVRDTITSGRARNLEEVDDLVTVYKRGGTSGLTQGCSTPHQSR